MKLPDLPRVLKKKEASWTTVFNKWLRDEFKNTCVCEIKHTHGKDYLPFSAVKNHQLGSLIEAETKTFVYKLPDMGGKQPFDVVSIAKQPAYIVIRYPTFFCLITTTWWRLEMATSARRSLTSKRAREIAHLVVEL